MHCEGYYMQHKTKTVEMIYTLEELPVLIFFARRPVVRKITDAIFLEYTLPASFTGERTIFFRVSNMEKTLFAITLKVHNFII